MRTFVLSLFLLGAAAQSRAAGTLPLVASDIDGASHALIGSRTNSATVLLFVMKDCPISNTYAPEIHRLCDEYGARGVAFYIVHADGDTTAAEARKHANDYSLPCPLFLDPKHVLVKRAGATITPEAAVFGKDGTLMYRGRIDDLYADYGRKRSRATTHDLREALDRAIAGRATDKPWPHAIGCFLPDVD